MERLTNILGKIDRLNLWRHLSANHHDVKNQSDFKHCSQVHALPGYQTMAIVDLSQRRIVGPQVLSFNISHNERILWCFVEKKFVDSKNSVSRRRSDRLAFRRSKRQGYLKVSESDSESSQQHSTRELGVAVGQNNFMIDYHSFSDSLNMMTNDRWANMYVC